MKFDMRELRKEKQPESLVKAKKLLDECMHGAQVLPASSQLIVAQNQDKFYAELFRPYTEYEKVIVKINAAKGKVRLVGCNLLEKRLFSFYCGKKVVFAFSLSGAIRSLFVTLYDLVVRSGLQSLLNLLSFVLALFIRRKHMLHMGDFIHPKLFWDFRLAGIFQELDNNNRKVHLFVRSLERPQTLLGNYFKRLGRGYISFYFDVPKNIMGYIENIGRVLGSISGSSGSFARLYSMYFPLGTTPTKLLIFKAKMLYWMLGIKSGFIGSATNRVVPELLAARYGRMKAVGIIHGAPIINFNLWEYFDSFDKRLRLDAYAAYGVWSKPMLDYLQERTHYFGKNTLKVSGYLQGYAAKPEAFKKVGPKPKLLWICEPSTPAKQAVAYIKAALEAGYSVGLSKRPMIEDAFWKGLKQNNPEVIEACAVEEQSIFDNARKYDVVVGACSTAVLDGLLVGSRFLFINTPKWGDTFEFDSFHKLPELFCKDPKDMLAKIKRIGSVPDNTWQHVREFYYNPDLDGGKWVAEQLIALAKK